MRDDMRVITLVAAEAEAINRVQENIVRGEGWL
jgi:hypothetical protein